MASWKTISNEAGSFYRVAMELPKSEMLNQVSFYAIECVSSF